MNGLPLDPVVEALELLTRAWNPPHRLPRPVRSGSDTTTFEFPMHTLHLPWAGSHLRGLRLASAPDSPALAHCDLRGCEVPGIAGTDGRFGLLPRTRAAIASKLAVPSLQAPSRALQSGHRGPVSCLAFSPDGLRLATGGSDRGVHLWALHETGLRELALIDRGERVHGLAFDPRSDRLSTVGDEGVVRLWTLRDDRAEGVVAANVQHGPLTCVAFSAEGDLLAGGSASGEVALWAVEGDTLRVVKLLEGRGMPVTGLAFSPDGRTLAIACLGFVQLFDVDTANTGLIAEPDLHEGQVRRIAFSPDGRLLAAAGRVDGDGIVWLWYADDLREFVALRAQAQSAVDVAFSPHGGQLANVDQDGVVHLWQIEGRDIHETSQLHGVTATQLAFDPAGQRIATTGADGTVRLWALHRSGAREIARVGGDTMPLRSSVFSLDGKRMASGGDDGRLHLWTLQEPGARELAVLDAHSNGVAGIAFSDDGRHLATAGIDGELRLWEWQDGGARALASHDALRGIVMAGIAFLPGGERLLVATRDGRIHSLTWADPTSRQTPMLVHTQRSLRFASLSPDARRLATVDGDGVMRVWNLSETGTSEISLLEQNRATEVVSIAFSSAGTHLVSGNKNGTLQLWICGVQAIGPLSAYTGHEAPVRRLAFSADGTTLASGDERGQVRLWMFDGLNLHAGPVMQAHEEAINSLAFSPDGRTLASSSRDGTLRLSPVDGKGSAWHWIGKGLALLVRDGDDSVWTLARSDGQPFDTLERNGQTIAADAFLYDWLWFGDPAWGHVPAFEVPPQWLQWSADRRTVTVSRAPHLPDELMQWVQSQTEAGAPPA